MITLNTEYIDTLNSPKGLLLSIKVIEVYYD